MMGSMKEAKIKDIRDHPRFKDSMVEQCEVERHPSAQRIELDAKHKKDIERIQKRKQD
jgi:hypothetical protein